MKKTDTGYLQDEPYQILKDSDQIPPIILKWLCDYSWCAKALNNSKNPLKAALTLINKHSADGGELEKYILRKKSPVPASSEYKLSDQAQELLHKHRKLLRDNSENNFAPEEFHNSGDDNE